jgi:hypothetical protein
MDYAFSDILSSRSLVSIIHRELDSRKLETQGMHIVRGQIDILFLDMQKETPAKQKAGNKKKSFPGQLFQMLSENAQYTIPSASTGFILHTVNIHTTDTMSFPFQIIDHIIPGQHIREYPHSTKGKQETPHRIAIKQYIPIDRPTPIQENAITIIGSPGNGSPKEAYEPLWQDLYTELIRKGIPLRGIWIADISNQGASGVLNEYIQGDQSTSSLFLSMFPSSGILKFRRATKRKRRIKS